MINRLEIVNFKSYKSATLDLAPLTFLIGANASGKSNALEAIRLLNWLAKGSRLEDIERAIQSGDSVVRGQAKDLFQKASDPFSIGATIAATPHEQIDLKVEISYLRDQLIISGETAILPTEQLPLYQIDSNPNTVTDEVSVMYNNFKRGRNKPHIPCSNRQAVFYQLETPGRFNKNDERAQGLIPNTTREIRHSLRSIVFLDPRPALMRDYVYKKDNEINESGSNASAVLHRTCESTDGKTKILNFIKSLPEQNITNIQFIETDRNDVMVRLEESFGKTSRTLDAPLLSDGTLRVLAIGATLLTAPPESLVIIEEIDNGVHPSRADLLVQQIRKVATERNLRVLLTTHNPALLNAVPDEILKDVVYCFRDPIEGYSRLIRLGDHENYSELVAQGPLGELMTRRVIERFVKAQNNFSSRKENALEWLNQLQKKTDS